MMSNVLNIVIGVALLFVMTTLGSALVFVFKKDISKKLNVIFLGFAAGVMIAASVWSLILPALEYSNKSGQQNFLPVALGFLGGGLFLVVLDKAIEIFLKKSIKGKKGEIGNSEIPQFSDFSTRKSLKLFVAVTVHNIPEGLAVGIAYGAAIVAGTQAAFMSALGVAIGIALQNLPEGAAISLPMMMEKNSKWKAFLFGASSGVVEPISALIGIVLATSLTQLMPWALSFAAGAMIFVVAEDLMPEAKSANSNKISAWAVMAGFLLMMALDILLA